MRKFGKELRPIQEEAVKVILSNKSLFFHAPTGTGKTLVGMIAAEQSKKMKKKFVILNPLKALTDEHEDTFNKYFKVVAISGDRRENKPLFTDKQYDGFVITYEMFLQTLINHKDYDPILNEIGYIIIDEAHNIGDSSRGAGLESILLLTHQLYPDIKFLFLSATFHNVSDFTSHFGCQLVRTEKRSIDLDIDFFEYTPATKYREKKEVFQKNLIECVAAEFKKYPGCQILVFCNSRQKTKNFLKILTEKIPNLKAELHHADVEKDEKPKILNRYRKGETNLICCTTTLAAGLNTPTDITIISEYKRYNPLTNDKEFLTPMELHQMAGRAGRVGNQPKLIRKIDGKEKPFGKAIFIVPNSEVEVLKEHLEKKVVIESKIEEHLSYILCAWIKAGSNNETKIYKLYEKRFMNVKEPDIDRIKIEEKLTFLKKNHFIRRNVNDLHLLDRGRICALFAIKPETILEIISNLHKFKQFDHEPNLEIHHLLVSVLHNSEFREMVHLNLSNRNDSNCFDNAGLIIGKYCNYLEQTGIMEEQDEGVVRKIWGLLFAEYINTRYCDKTLDFNIPDEMKKFHFLKVKPRGEAANIIQQVRRFILALKILFTNEKTLNSKFSLLNDILEGNPPSYDLDILEYVKIPKIGVKYALYFIGAGYDSPQKLLKESSMVIRRNLNAFKSRLEENQDQKKSIRLPSENTIKKLQELIKNPSDKEKSNEESKNPTKNKRKFKSLDNFYEFNKKRRFEQCKK